MSEEILKKQQELAALIDRHTRENGVHETAIPSLFLIRESNVYEPAFRVVKPSFCFIAQGVKEILLAQERFIYSSADYLVTSVDLPVVGQTIKATADVPYLCLKLEFTQSQILEVLNDSVIQITPKENAKRALFVGKIDITLLDATLRLARLLDNPKDIPFLGSIYTREVLYRLLQGSYGSTLAQIAMEKSSTYRIRDAIEQVISNMDKPLRIESLAETASMSTSSFHRHFKEVTAMSPIQFQKQLRLQEARRLLLSESTDAADVAYRVGYESASQFSREYARMFGSPPRTDIRRLKEKYERSLNA
ncbi:AraC family transcriptional regulator N-terminal domain-containing protein [Paenibacillus sp. sgz500958]|uniref:AraC family transcriptional regulator n=1 Tax=Paenibacillus sp. sgz500958 TaxID=3242475 RepID=UPI0036D2285A